MLFDVAGRVRNTQLAKRNAMLPVYEAVVNSIQAIDERGGAGQVFLHIERTPPQIDQETGDIIFLGKVSGFTVEDNGAGFHEESFRAFCTADTTRKAASGGRGLGRFLWLKAFDEVSVTSSFFEDGQWHQREFRFAMVDDGVLHDTLTEAPSPTYRTLVSLARMKQPYVDAVPQTAAAVARRLLEHCFLFFVLGAAPRIVVRDAQASTEVDLGDLYQEEVLKNAASTSVNVDRNTVEIRHLFVAPTFQGEHALHFCANKRLVFSEKLATHSSHLRKPLRSDGDSPTYYAAFVTSPYLDSVVTPDRTDFFDRKDLLSGSEDDTWGRVRDAAIAEALRTLQPHISPLQEKAATRISAYVSKAAPHYRYAVARRPEAIKHLGAELTDRELDLELYKIDHALQVELKEDAHRLLESMDKAETLADVQAQFAKFLEEWNEAKIADLARYVVHRREVLEMFKRALSRRTTGGYELEAMVHGIVMPTKRTSDDVPYADQNLWLIDERLAFHRFLASDRPIASMPLVDSNSKDRPDIVVFENPAAFGEGGGSGVGSSLTVVEFKRPGRDDYEDGETIVHQVWRYIDQIRKRSRFDEAGRPLVLPDSAPAFAYVLCDLTERVRAQCVREQMTEMADQRGFFNFHPAYRVFTWVLSFDKVVDEAFQRNAAFFDRLNLPG